MKCSNYNRQFTAQQEAAILRLYVQRYLPPSGTARRKLESELRTTRDVILARKYGVSRELVRQIRQRLGYPSSQILRHEWTIRARAERRERQQIERGLRQKERRKSEWMAIKRLSARWKSGVTVHELAKEDGVSWGSLNSRIVRWRKRYPQKFPYRRPDRLAPRCPARARRPAHNRDL